MVRHFDQEDREAEGGEYGNALKSILTKRFRKMVRNFLQILNGGIIHTKEATESDSSVAKRFRMIWCTYVRFRDTQEEKHCHLN